MTSAPRCDCDRRVMSHVRKMRASPAMARKAKQSFTDRYNVAFQRYGVAVHALARAADAFSAAPTPQSMDVLVAAALSYAAADSAVNALTV